MTSSTPQQRVLETAFKGSKVECGYVFVCVDIVIACNGVSVGHIWFQLYFCSNAFDFVSRVCAQHAIVTQSHTSPHLTTDDSTHLSVIGDGFIKLYRFTDGALKQLAFPKTENLVFSAHTWLSDNRLIVGTTTGVLV